MLPNEYTYHKLWIGAYIIGVLAIFYVGLCSRRGIVRSVRVKIHVDRAKFDTSIKISHLMEFEA